METLHKLAGVQDAYDQDTAEPSQPVNTNNDNTIPPPVPSKDEADANGSTTHLPGSASGPQSRGASRASLPLNRKPSHKSFQSSKRARSRSRGRDPRSSSQNNLNSTSAAQGSSIPPTPTISKNYHDPGSATPTTPRNFDEKEFGLTYPSAPAHDDNVDDDEEEEEGDEDFAWGPSHPCFPHPNPHCMPNSPEAQSTRVIRVKRDWLLLGDLCPQYANLYPEILDPLVSDADFRLLISRINSLTRAALEPSTTVAWLDSLLGAFTGFLWEDLGLTNSKRGEKRLERFLDTWNRERSGEGKDVRVIQLRRTGFMSLDFVIPDPGIDGVDEEDPAHPGQRETSK